MTSTGPHSLRLATLSFLLKFQKILDNHNRTHNPSGVCVNRQLKRPAGAGDDVEPRIEIPPSETAVATSSGTRDAKDKGELKQNNNVFMTDGKEPFYDHVFGEDG